MNEEQLREFYTNFGKYTDIESTDERSLTSFVMDEMEKALLQAELNWLTAQIERGEGKKRNEWDDITCGECKKPRGSSRNQINTEWNSALSDLLKPLIERKKEVEGKLLSKENV